MDFFNSAADIDEHLDRTLSNYATFMEPFEFNPRDFEDSDENIAVLCPSCNAARNYFDLVHIRGQRLQAQCTICGIYVSKEYFDNLFLLPYLETKKNIDGRLNEINADLNNMTILKKLNEAFDGERDEYYKQARDSVNQYFIELSQKSRVKPLHAKIASFLSESRPEALVTNRALLNMREINRMATDRFSRRSGADIGTRDLLQSFQQTPETIIAISECEKQVNKFNCLHFISKYVELEGLYEEVPKGMDYDEEPKLDDVGFTLKEEDFIDDLVLQASELKYIMQGEIEEYKPFIQVVRQESRGLLKSYYNKDDITDDVFEDDRYIDLFAMCCAQKKNIANVVNEKKARLNAAYSRSLRTYKKTLYSLVQQLRSFKPVKKEGYKNVPKGGVKYKTLPKFGRPISQEERKLKSVIFDMCVMRCCDLMPKLEFNRKDLSPYKEE